MDDQDQIVPDQQPASPQPETIQPTIEGQKVLQPSAAVLQELQAEQSASQIATPITVSATPTAANTYESIILSDTGQLENVFQGGVKTKNVTLTLYTTHLRIDNAATGETIEDIPLDQIKKLSRVFKSRFMYSLATRGILGIKTASKYYKISWANLNAEAILLGRSAPATNAVRNFKKNMMWIKAIKSLQAGQPVTQADFNA